MFMFRPLPKADGSSDHRFGLLEPAQAGLADQSLRLPGADQMSCGLVVGPEAYHSGPEAYHSGPEACHSGREGFVRGRGSFVRDRGIFVDGYRGFVDGYRGFVDENHHLFSSTYDRSRG